MVITNQPGNQFFTTFTNSQKHNSRGFILHSMVTSYDSYDQTSFVFLIENVPKPENVKAMMWDYRIRDRSCFENEETTTVEPYSRQSSMCDGEF